MTFGRNIEKTGIEFACFSFHLGLLFYRPRLSNRTSKNANFDVVSSKRVNFDVIQ